MVQQGLALTVSSAVLDGGDLFRICSSAAIAFWTGAALICFRRPTPKMFDLVFIHMSYLPLCVLTFFLTDWIWEWRGAW